MKKKALVLLVDGVEEIEFSAPVDLLRRAEVEVVTASVMQITKIKGKQGIALIADMLLAELSSDEFDMLIIPGGPGVLTLRKLDFVLELIKEFHTRGKWIAAICAAPLLLKDVGLLEGRSYTCHDSCEGELPDADFERKVIVDGKLITSRGPGSALDFGLQLVETLCDKTIAENIKKDIMA